MSFVRPKAAWLILLLFVLFAATGCSENETALDPGDTDPPTVTGHYPADGATGVSRSGPFWVVFSEAMDEESVESTLGFDLDEWEYDLYWNGDTLFIAPYSQLPASNVFTITIDGDCEDISGNKLGSDYSFTFTTTSEEDNTAPYVVMTVPADEATDVSPGMPIVITFSEPMNMTNTSNAITISPEPEEVDLDWKGPELTILHYPFPQDSGVEVTIGTGATDLAGNPLATAYSFDFRTAIDDVRPYLVSATPSNGATGVSTGLGEMVLNFSETMYPDFDMPPENVDARINQVVDGDNVDWNEAYSTMFVPLRSDRNLLPGCRYWVKFEDVMDAAGNYIDPNPTTYGFTTAGERTHFIYKSGSIYFVDTRTHEPDTMTIENYSHGSGTFDIVFRDFDGIDEIWHMRNTGNEIQHLGRDEYDNGVYDFTMTWDTPLPYLKLPIGNYVGQTWHFDTSATIDEHYSIEITGSVEIEAYPVNLESELLHGTFAGCYIHHLDAATTFYEDGTPVDEGSFHEKSWLAEGIGRVMIVIEEDGDPPDTLVVFDWDI